MVLQNGKKKIRDLSTGFGRARDKAARDKRKPKSLAYPCVLLSIIGNST
jgi:hypothetical protein